MWLLSLPYHMEGWRQGSSFLWKRDWWSCQVVRKYRQWLSWEEIETPFWQEPTPILRCKTSIPPSNPSVSSPAGASLGKHPLLCLGPVEILCLALRILSQQDWPCLSSWSLFIAFCLHKMLWTANWPQLNVRCEWSRFPLPAVLLPEILWWYLVLFVSASVCSSSSVVWQFGAQCPMFRSQTGLTSPQAGVGGFTGSLLSVPALLVQAKRTLHSQTI